MWRACTDKSIETGTLGPDPGGQVNPRVGGVQQLRTERSSDLASRLNQKTCKDKPSESGTLGPDPGGQVNQHVNRVQRLLTGSALLPGTGGRKPGVQAEGGVLPRDVANKLEEYYPGGQVGQVAGGERQICNERGILPRDVADKLVEYYPDRSNILPDPRLRCLTGALSATIPKPNLILNVDFVPTNDRREPEAAAGMDRPQASSVASSEEIN